METSIFTVFFLLFSILSVTEGGFFDLYCYRCHSNEKGCGEKLNWWLLQREVRNIKGAVITWNDETFFRNGCGHVVLHIVTVDLTIRDIIVDLH